MLECLRIRFVDFGSLTTGETRRYTNFTVPIGCSISQ